MELSSSVYSNNVMMELLILSFDNVKLIIIISDSTDL